MKSMDLPESPLPSYATYFVEGTVVGRPVRSCSIRNGGFCSSPKEYEPD